MKEANPPKELAPSQLAWKLDPTDIPYETSDDCSACTGIIGQENALKAVQTGLAIKSLGYNIFITGVAGTGRTTTIKQLLDKLEKDKKTPDDIVYVHNFKSPDEPFLITFPAGKGALFKTEMENLIEDLKLSIPEFLKSSFYTEKRDHIIEIQQKKHKEILNEFEKTVAKEGFSVIQVQMGPYVKPDLIPIIEGKPYAFNKLEAEVLEKKFPRKKLEELRAKYDELTEKLEAIFKILKETEENTRRLLKDWDDKAITPVIKEAVDKIRAKFHSAQTKKYLEMVEAHLIEHFDLFKDPQKENTEKKPAQTYLEYQVNLLIDNSNQKGAPVIIETNPNFINLFGSIESTINRMGILQTDFTKIKAGSFLKANGGYLVINALEALVEPGVWPTLKRTLKNQTLEIQNMASLYLVSTTHLKPQLIDIDVKVVMIGDSHIYNLMYYGDSSFKKIFKIKAEFDSVTRKNKKTIGEYVSFIKKITKEDNLIGFDREGMAAIIEYGTRLAGKQKKITTRFHQIADIIREASYWARKDKQSMAGRIHVEKAIKERFNRVGLIERKIQEMIDEGSIMIDTRGGEIGQVNGLAVYTMGDFAFGKPTRITATTSVGRAGVINIEREADLSGRTHNKGVLILGGYLREKYAQNKPFSLSASLAFEQSYSGVDGDSASSTEVYALLSSLSKLPLRQDIAVTGSLNQKGEIQPIGGVNEKVEGFFDVCKAKRLTGKQGVMIPYQNVPNLMLRRDIVEAVEAGEFHIYPVATIEEGIEILTGIKAGKRKADGSFEKDTINARVDQELQRLARSWKTFASSTEKEKKG